MTGLRIGTLLDLKHLQKVLDSFSEATGFATVTVDPRGLPVTEPSGFTDFCKAMRSDAVRSKLCHGCDAHGGLQSLIDGKPRVYRCHAGLVDFSVPVAADDTYVGAILCGQVRVPEAEQPAFLTSGLSWSSEPDLEELYQQVPTTSTRRVRAAVDTLLGLGMELDGATKRHGQRTSTSEDSAATGNHPKLSLVALESPTEPAAAAPHNQQPDQAAGPTDLLRKCLITEDLAGALAQLDLLLDHAYSATVETRSSLTELEDRILDATPDCAPRLVPHLTQVIQRHRKGRSAYSGRYASQLYFERLLAMVLEETKRSRPQRRRDIRDLLNSIALRPNRAISLTEAANDMHWSPGHLSKLFKSVTGCTFVSYVTSKRISRARLMLASTQMPVRKIATELDFNQVNYFSRVFRAYAGVSPSEYRRQCLLFDGRTPGVSVPADHHSLLRA